MEENKNRLEFMYGKIVDRVVLYNGESLTLDNGIKYINIREYLNKI